MNFRRYAKPTLIVIAAFVLSLVVIRQIRERVLFARLDAYSRDMYLRSAEAQDFAKLPRHCAPRQAAFLSFTAPVPVKKIRSNDPVFELIRSNIVNFQQPRVYESFRQLGRIKQTGKETR